MITAAVSRPLVQKPWFDADRVGVFASVLCAIHCVLTPILLLMLPAFGRAWSHPASHWGMALFVVPVAAFTLTRGFRKHRRRWVVGAGMLGMAFVLVGAAVPYLGENPASSSGGSPSSESNVAMAKLTEEDAEVEGATIVVSEEQCATECESEERCATECESEERCATECETVGAKANTTHCEDLCCPTLQAGTDGGWKLHIPLASILTTLGGLSLIATHLGNLCCCSACKTQNELI